MQPDKIVVVQTHPATPPGLLSAWARVRDCTLDVRRVDLGDPLPDAPGAIAILGPDTPLDDDVTWLPGLLSWTGDALLADVPILGIAFGAQLLAHLLGAEIAHDDREPLGWTPVDTHEAWLPAGPWISHRGDRIRGSDELRIVAGDDTRVQAFTDHHGRHLGLQFHPEATVALIPSWAQDDVASDEARVALSTQTARHSAAATANARALFDAWASGGQRTGANERELVAA